MMGVSLERGHLETDTQGDYDMEMTAEIWVVLLQTKGEMASKQRELGKGLAQTIPHSLRGHQPDIVVLDV